MQQFMKIATQWGWWLLLALLLTTGYWLAAEQGVAVSLPGPTLGNSDMRIIANQGQWDEAARYRIPLNGGQVWLEQQAMVYQLHEPLPDNGHGHEHGHRDAKVTPVMPDSLRQHLFRVRFADSRPDVVLEPGLRYPEYNNYFIGNDPARWAGGVSLYGLLTYRELYPSVDLRLYGQGDYLKYDFLIAPGGDPAQIRLTFEGVTPRLTKQGELVYDVGFRQVTEQAPLAYQLMGEDKRIIPCEYRLTDMGLSYHFPEGYDPDYPLVIDPTLEFSTYTGSASDNWGFTATYDTAGNAYGGGIQYGQTVAFGYPTTPGAFQTVFNGGLTDATISKFSSDGSSLLYSTFIGGIANDQPHSMIVNSKQELIVMGRTESTNFPIPANGYQPTHQGGWDMFVVRFNTTGTALLGGTYLGGSGDDGVNIEAWTDNANIYNTTKYNYGDDSRGEVIVDLIDDIILTAPTKSANFPVTPNAAQSTYGGNQDGMVAKLSPDLTNLIWSTYFGGSAQDASHTVKLDENGAIFIAGGTASSNLPTTAGALQPSYGGGVTDGFVASISQNGQSIVACTYLGTNLYDQVFLLEFDRLNFVYVTGQTLGNWPVINPLIGPVYQVPNGKMFINKLSNDLSSNVFSTRFGAPNNNVAPNFSPTAFLVDRCDNMYLAGWGVGQLGGSPNQGTTSGLPTMGGPFIDTSTDGVDMYLMSLSRDAQALTYATFMGGAASEHLDGGTCRFDKNGILYHAVCAGCGGNSSFPATAGAYRVANGSFNCNLAVFKMAFELDGVEADFTPLDLNNQPLNALSGCAPLDVNFDNRSFRGANPGNVQYFWDFGYGGQTSTQVEPTFTYPDPGTYQARLVIVDSASCNITDTAYREIVVFPPPAVDAGPNQNICPDDTVVLQTLSTAVSYQWSPATFVLGNPNQATVQVRVPTTTRFILTIVNANGCEAKDTIIVSTESLEINAGEDTTVCEGGGATLTATSPDPITSYAWTSSPPVPIATPNQASISVSNLTSTTTFFLLVEDSIGCRGRDTVVVEVFEVQTLEDTFVCEGSSFTLVTSNGVSFSWLPDDGSLSDPTIASPVATPTQTTTYSVRAVSVAGCISDKDVLVEVFALPTPDAGLDTALCIGESAQLQGTGGFIYRWTPSESLSDSSVADPFATPTQTTEYVLTVADRRGCENQDTVQIQVNPLPIVDAGEDETICEFDSIGLEASGAFFYEWFPVSSLDDPTVANPVAFPQDTTEYVVLGTDLNGCVNRDSVVIAVISKPITVVEGINFCDLRYVELQASGGDTYQWNTGQTSPLIEVIPPSEPQTYIATAFVGGCEGVPDTIVIDENFGYPEADFEVQQQHDFAPQRIDFLNQSTGAIRYIWTFGFIQTPDYREHPSFGYPSAGQYEVRLIAISEGNCPDTAYQTVDLDNITLFVPSGFSPNDDGVNDGFLVGQTGLGSLQVRIYSRWGEEIYESNNLDFRWDGTREGRPVQEGVYVYVVRAVGINGVPFTRHGTITLFR
jgi:gliding motility-associated-like protein